MNVYRKCIEYETQKERKKRTNIHRINAGRNRKTKKKKLLHNQKNGGRGQRYEIPIYKRRTLR